MDGIYDAIRNAGLPLSERPHPDDLGDALVNCVIKCETAQSGRLRGHRLVSLNDSDCHHTLQTKAAVGGVAAAATGRSGDVRFGGGAAAGPLGWRHGRGDHRHRQAAGLIAPLHTP